VQKAGGVPMTVRDEILDDLRAGTSFGEITAKYRTKSGIYEAIRIFLPELETKLEEKRKSFEKADTDLFKAQNELGRLTRENNDLVRKNGELRKEKEKLTSDVAGMRDELDLFCASKERLESEGYTGVVMKKIAEIERRSGSQLLKELKTLEKYRRIKREVAALVKKEASLKEEVKSLKAKKKETEKKIVSKRNQLDELKLQTAVHKQAISVVTKFFKDGYDSKDLLSLKYGLDTVGIAGDPTTSIARLVNGLKKEKNIFDLEERTAEKRKELAFLDKALVETKTELKIINEETLNRIEETKNTSVDTISHVGEKANLSIDDTSARFETRLDDSFGKFDDHICQTMTVVRDELAEWGELKQQMGRLQEALGPGIFLLGVLKSTEYLKTVPLAFIVHLFDRLSLWAQINMENVKVKPSANIQRREPQLFSWQLYEFSALVEFVAESLKQILIQKNKT